ncbi:PH domain-containing protein [Thermodesulfobacteriota bacterium]
MVDIQKERILWESEFDPRVRTYWLLSGIWILTVTVVGILLIPFWFAIGRVVTGRYLSRIKCVLTEKKLHVSKGILIRVEKTVPLDKITDIGLVQGPIMRHFGLESLTVETAGQSSEGALVKIIGIIETRKFRDAVLRQRDEVVAAMVEDGHPSGEVPAMSNKLSDSILADIRDTLRRIESQLEHNEDA